MSAASLASRPKATRIVRVSILVLGGSGFLGKPVVESLQLKGLPVVAASRDSQATYRVDLRDPANLELVLDSARPTQVLNLLSGGLSSRNRDSWADDLEAIDVRIPLALFRWAAAAPDSRAVFHATSALMRSPHESAYAAAKRRAHLMLAEERDSAGGREAAFTSVILHNCYGPGLPSERFLAVAVERFASGEALELQHPHRIRDFVWLGDAVDAVTDAMVGHASGLREVEVGTGSGTTINEAARQLARIVGADPDELVREAEHATCEEDRIVSLVPGGTAGMCRTSLTDGLARWLGGTS